MKVSTRLEGDLGEVEVDDLFSTLRKRCEFKENGAILRLSTDKEYWAVIAELFHNTKRAHNGAGLVGGTVKVWSQNGLYPDGDGWRMVIVSQELTMQLPPGVQPPPGLKLVP